LLSKPPLPTTILGSQTAQESTVPSKLQGYRYFQNVFGRENQKALIKELSQTVISAKAKNPSLGNMELKIALIRR
jgi:hypothetical protein